MPSQVAPKDASSLVRCGTTWFCMLMQVLRLPAGAQLLATTPTSPLDIWGYGNRLLALQGHPEFNCPLVVEKILQPLSAIGCAQLCPCSASLGFFRWACVSFGQGGSHEKWNLEVLGVGLQIHVPCSASCKVCREASTGAKILRPQIDKMQCIPVACMSRGQEHERT